MTGENIEDMGRDESTSGREKADEAETGHKMGVLSKRRRFQVWSLAMSLNPKGQPVSYLRLMIHFIGTRKATVSRMTEDDAKVLGERLCAVVALNNHLHLIIGMPSDNVPDSVWRQWFRQVAEGMYYCLVAKRKDGRLDIDFLTRWCDQGAPYFATVLSTQWDGSLARFGPLAEQQRWEELLPMPEHLLTLIRKLRHSKILLLGKYTGEGGKRLRRLQSLIAKRDLTPVIFGDLYGCSQAVAQGKVKEEVLTVAKLSELVLVEDSEASGHLLELADLGSAMVKTAILRHTTMGSTILVESLLKKYGAFMKLFEYTDRTLNSVLDKVFTWHEKTKLTG